MKHVVFANYTNDESYDIETTLSRNGFDWGQPLVKAQKALLKQHGYPQKSHCAIVVDDKALTFLNLKLTNIKSAVFA